MKISKLSDKENYHFSSIFELELKEIKNYKIVQFYNFPGSMLINFDQQKISNISLRCNYISLCLQCTLYRYFLQAYVPALIAIFILSR